METFNLSHLAVPAVSVLIVFLSYSSQVLFLYIDPAPLSHRELIHFNLLLTALWICYYRACMTDPGHIPPEWTFQPHIDEGLKVDGAAASQVRRRWCRKCDAAKPPRSHHCKVCARCIPKMDHHCPWTSNCVSYFTFPHFIRFLCYAVVSMIYLEKLLFVRLGVLWNNRHLPSYLGPSAFQLVHLFILAVVNSLTLFLVSITFVRTLWGLGANITTIESWEIERHQRLLRRARVLGGYLDGPDGIKVRIQKQEFPYDIGIWKNIKQGIGGTSLLTLWWPFTATPTGSGIDFETNGFEDPSTSWPPPDPDRMPRFQPLPNANEAFTYPKSSLSNYEEIEAFKKRQQEDYMRRQGANQISRRKRFHERYTNHAPKTLDKKDKKAEDKDGDQSGEEGWLDPAGNRLGDWGVDEDAEFYDEDNIPLSELLSRRRAKNL